MRVLVHTLGAQNDTQNYPPAPPATTTRNRCATRSGRVAQCGLGTNRHRRDYQDPDPPTPTRPPFGRKAPATDTFTWRNHPVARVCQPMHVEDGGMAREAPRGGRCRRRKSSAGLGQGGETDDWACALARAAPSSEVFEVTVTARARCPEGSAGHGPCAMCHIAHTSEVEARNLRKGHLNRHTRGIFKKVSSERRTRTRSCEKVS